MADSNPCRWDLTVVDDVIAAIGRSRGLTGWRFDAWSDEAWTIFFRRSDALWATISA